MLKSIVLSFLTLFSTVPLIAQRANQDSQINIIPQPVKLTTSKGLLDLSGAIGGLTPAREVYTFEPLPAELTDQETKFMLGAQANV